MTRISHPNPARIALALALALSAAVTCVVLLSASADAAKGKKKAANKAQTFSTGDLNTLVPEEDAAGVDGFVKVPIKASGKALKGKEIADVNANLRVSGVVESVGAKLTAPNGASTWLVFGEDTEGDRWGTGAASCTGSFMTFDDETSQFAGTLPKTDPAEVLSPYFARVEAGGNPLQVMDGGPVKGTWTLTMLDDDDDIGQATLHCAQVVVKPRNKVP